MLLKGGNAFDAAVAVGGMIALGEPEMNGIGGNGFVTLFDKKSGKVLSLSMAGAAPKALKPAEMTPATLNAGMKAGIVPGNLGGYLYLLDRFGTMTIADVFAPAIEYAEKGYPIDPMLADDINRGKANLSKYPTTAKIYLPGGQPLKAGDLLKNPDYAATLRKLVEAEQQAHARGASRSAAIKAAFDRFYKGDIAQEFDPSSKRTAAISPPRTLAATAAPPSRSTRHRGYDAQQSGAARRSGADAVMAVEGFDPSHGAGSPGAHAMIRRSDCEADIYRYVVDP
jgi:gamma-glutamyltranspeptidase/glutathione hydrolase